MTNNPPVVICDAGPLIHLDELECISLLSDFRQVLAPEQVWDEVALHRPNLAEQLISTIERVPVVLSTSPLFQTLVHTFALDFGEQAALSLAESYAEAIFLTYDAADRLAASALGLEVHGTVGILLRAIRREQRSRREILIILQQIPERSSLHIKPSLLREIINRLEL